MLFGFLRRDREDIHLASARHRQNKGARLWQNNHHLYARYKFWRAGTKSKLCWIDSGDFMAEEARTTPGVHAKHRATRLAKKYYLRALSGASSPDLYEKIAAQYTALRVLDCASAAQVTYGRKASEFSKRAAALRFRDMPPPRPPPKPLASYGDTSVPAADEGPVPFLAARRQPAAMLGVRNGLLTPTKAMVPKMRAVAGMARYRTPGPPGRRGPARR